VQPRVQIGGVQPVIYKSRTGMYFGRPFLKRFALCYRAVFLSCLYCIGVLWPNGWTDQDETWRAGRPRPRPHCVTWGPSFPQNGHSPQFSDHVRCGQTARWIKMTLGTEEGLGPGDFALDGDPAPPPKGGQPPNFRPMSIVAKRLDRLLWVAIPTLSQRAPSAFHF